MLKSLLYTLLIIVFWPSSSKAIVITDVLPEKYGDCIIDMDHRASGGEYASLSANINIFSPKCDITSDDFLKLLGQALDNLKNRKDLKPVNRLLLGLSSPLLGNTHDEILSYYKKVIPKELEEALKISGKYKFHHQTLDPLKEHLSDALLSTEFFSKLKIQLKKSGYKIGKIEYEKFIIFNENNKKTITSGLIIHINEVVSNN